MANSRAAAGDSNHVCGACCGGLRGHFWHGSHAAGTQYCIAGEDNQRTLVRGISSHFYWIASVRNIGYCFAVKPLLVKTTSCMCDN